MFQAVNFLCIKNKPLDFRKQSTENFQGFFEEEMRGNPYGLEK